MNAAILTQNASKLRLLNEWHDCKNVFSSKMSLSLKKTKKMSGIKLKQMSDHFKLACL